MTTAEFVLSARDDTKAAFASVEGGLRNLDKALGVFGVSLAAIAAGAVAMVKQQTDLADETSKTAARLGTTTEALSAMRYAADLAGVSNESLTNSLRLMSRNLSDAAQGTGSAVQAVRELGLSARDLAGLAPEQAVQKIADAMLLVPTASDRVRIAMDVFGRSGADMINVMAGGSAGIRDAMQEAERFGVVISTSTGQAAERFNDNVSRLKANFTGLANSLTAEVLPALVRLTDRLLDSDALDALAEKRTRIMIQYQNLAQQFAGGVLPPSVKVQMDLLKKDIDDTDARIIAANKKATAAKVMLGSGPDGTPLNTVANERAAKEDAARQAKFAKEYEQLSQSLLSQEQLEIASYTNRQMVLEQARQAGLATDEQYMAQRLLLTDQHEKAITKIRQDGSNAQQRLWQTGLNGQLSTASSIFGNLASLMTVHNKKAFAIGKAAAIGQALIETYLGAQKAYTAFAWNPPLAVAAAVAATTAGLVRVAAIRAQSFGGSGSAAPGGGSVPTFDADPNTGQPGYNPVPSVDTGLQANAPTRTANITLVGSFFTAEMMRDDIIPALERAWRDGAGNVQVTIGNT